MNPLFTFHPSFLILHSSHVAVCSQQFPYSIFLKQLRGPRGFFAAAFSSANYAMQASPNLR